MRTDNLEPRKKGRKSGASTTAPKVSATSYALTILSRRAVSTQELRTRLARRGYEAPSIDGAVAAMVDYGYLNDTALAQCITARAQREGRGARWVQRTLQQRGIEATLGGAQDGDDAAQRATEMLQRRFKGALSDRGDPKATARAVRFLCNRGFSPPTAWRIVTAARAAHVDEPPQEG